MRRRAAAVVIGVDGVSDFDTRHSGKHNESSARPMSSRWSGEDALLIFLRYGQADARKRGVFGAEPRVHKDGDGRATRQSCPGCMR
jgi:hypothetical protein